MRTMRAFACHCSSNKCTKCVESTPHSLHSYRHHCCHCHRHRHQRSRFLKVLRETLKQCQYVYHSHLSKIYLVYSRNELKEKTNRLLSTYRRPPSSTKFHSAVFIPQFDIYVCVYALAYREHSETVDNIELRTPKKCMLHTEQTRSTPSERRTHAHILYFVLDIKRVNRIHLSPPHNKCNHVIPYNSTCMLLQQNFRSLL